MKYRVVFTDPDQHTFEAELVTRLADAGAQFEVTPDHGETELVRRCRTADAIINSAAHISAHVIKNLERCRIIARVGTGFDNIDWRAAAERSIPVTNVPGFCTEEVANHTMALLLALHRRITTLDAEVRCGIWQQNHVLPVPRLSTLVLGIIGYGAIGRAVASRARAFGMEVIYFDSATPRETYDSIAISCDSIEALLERSDVISTHLPLTPETIGFLHRKRFERMKPTALLINTARGATVNEKDLIDALKNRTIAGAALDVLDREPPLRDNPLLELKNVILTPHCASHSNDSLLEVRLRTIDEVLRALRGEPLMHVVNGVQSRTATLIP